MDRRLKIGAAAVSVCFLAISLLLVYPSPLGVKIKTIVSADPTFDNNTAIDEVRIDNWSSGIGFQQICSFTDNGTTADVDVGENVMRLQCVVYIHSDYASSAAEAIANTRIYMTVKDPSETIKYQGWLDNQAGLVNQEGDVWKVTKRDNLDTDNGASFLLTEGTWTITTKYEAYA